MTKEYKTITEIKGPLIFVEKTEPVGYNELVEIRTGGDVKRGQVLDTSDEIVVVQLFEGTGGYPRTAPSSSPETSSRCPSRRLSSGVSYPDLAGPETAALRSCLKS